MIEEDHSDWATVDTCVWVDKVSLGSPGDVDLWITQHVHLVLERIRLQSQIYSEARVDKDELDLEGEGFKARSPCNLHSIRAWPIVRHINRLEVVLSRHYIKEALSEPIRYLANVRPRAAWQDLAAVINDTNGGKDSELIRLKLENRVIIGVIVVRRGCLRCWHG